MSQVLKYGLPSNERVVCDHPICEELATHQITQKTGDHRVSFACTEHVKPYLDTTFRSIEQLKVPGKLNPVDAPKPTR